MADAPMADAPVPMAVEAEEEEKEGPPKAVEEEAKATPEDQGFSLHVSCKDFVRVPEVKVKDFFNQVTAVKILKIFKVKARAYCFVNVAEGEVAAFKAALEGVNFRSHPITINDGKARDVSDNGPKKDEDGEEQPFKKRKKDFKEGYVPTLKDVKDKDKAHKQSGVEKTVLEKSCPLHKWDYPTQLTMKETYVKSTIRSFTKQARIVAEERGDPPKWTDPKWHAKCKAPYGCGCPTEPIIGTPEDSLEGYRNKCEFTIGHNINGEPEVGFVLKIHGDLGQVTDSAQAIPHVPKVFKKLCEVVRDCVKSSPFAIYDRRRDRKCGVWRIITPRLSANGDMMVLLQTAPQSDEDRKTLADPLVKALLAADIGFKSLYIQVNEDVCDACKPSSPVILVHGAERLQMPLMGLTFEIGPLSFYQANNTTCSLLYGQALSWLRPENALVLDVCCGVGTIGLCMASKCKRVVGVELVPEAVDSARLNAKVNGITNAVFHAGLAEEILPAILDDEVKAAGPDTEVCAIVDPPRPGLHKTVLYALRDCKQLSRIVYVSCNPETLAEDVVKLTTPRGDDDPFVPVKAVAVDMFPHTVHVEMILVLERASKAYPALEARSLAAPAGAADTSEGAASKGDASAGAAAVAPAAAAAAAADKAPESL